MPIERLLKGAAATGGHWQLLMTPWTRCLGEQKNFKSQSPGTQERQRENAASGSPDFGPMGDSVSSLHRRRASYSDSQFVAAQNVLLTMSPAADICTRQTGVIDSPQHSLEGLICFAPLAILELDPEGKIRRWNPAAERLFGWTESEVLGRANPLIAIEARAQYEAEVRHILKGATIQGKDVRRQHKDGRWIEREALGRTHSQAMRRDQASSPFLKTLPTKRKTNGNCGCRRRAKKRWRSSFNETKRECAWR